MWSVLFGGTVPWVAAIATLLLVLATTLLIIHQVRASDGDMSVRLRWLRCTCSAARRPGHHRLHLPVPTPAPAAGDPVPVHRRPMLGGLINKYEATSQSTGQHHAADFDTPQATNGSCEPPAA
jgi:hypothetical protein